MKNYTYYIVSFLIMIAAHSVTLGQGCVAVKNMPSCSLSADTSSHSGWQININYRYFRSFRHFKGTEEQKERLEKNTEVINNDNSVILGASYRLNQKWSFSLGLPISYIDRSSLYEHDRISRHHSQSSGIGDLRLTANRNFVLNNGTSISFGFGTKLPTGNYNVKDIFYTADGPQERPVDQSIQLGDGGVGLITEMNFFKAFGKAGIYLNSMYMFNPRNTNGTRTYRETLSPLLANEAISSVVDQYFARAGGQYMFGTNISAGIGARLEGIPVRDAIGKSDGFRRPGYIVSAEPSVSLTFGVHSFNVNVPVAIVRNRTQSLTDKATQRETGQPRHGDAAFADWLLSISYSYRL